MLTFINGYPWDVRPLKFADTYDTKKVCATCGRIQSLDASVMSLCPYYKTVLNDIKLENEPSTNTCPNFLFLK